MNLFLLVVVVLPWVGSGQVLAQGAPQPLTAQRVLAEARAHRQELAASRSRAEAAAQRPKLAGALGDPMLMGGVDHLPFSLMGANYSVQLQQEFPLSGLRGARERSASRQADVALAQLRVTSLEIEAAALRAFLMLVEAKRMKTVAAQLRGLAVEVHSAVEARVAATQASLSEAVRAEVEIARMDGELQAVDREVIGAWAMTEAAMGHARGTAPIPEVELDTKSEPPPAVGALIDLGFGQRPELAQMKGSIEAARAEAEVMSSMYFPMAFLRVGFARTMTDGPGLMVMGGVSLPIWREKLGAGSAEAAAMIRMAEADLEAMRTMIAGEVGAAREGVLAAQARFLAVRDRVLPLSQQSVRLSLVAYTSGQLPLVSVLDAARAQGEAQMDAVRAEIALDAAWIELERATGELGVTP